MRFVGLHTLYETYGVPLWLSRQLCERRGFRWDEEHERRMAVLRGWPQERFERWWKEAM